MSQLERGQSSMHLARVARGWILLFAACATLSLSLTSTPSRAQSPGDAADPDYPDLFQDLGMHLKRFYLALDRINPQLLLKKAFAALENAVDEIYVENSDSSSPVVTLRVDSKAESFDLESVETLEQAVKVLERVFVFLKQNYRGETKLNNIRYAAANGFLSGIDPHTIVFSPEDFKDFSVHIEGEICGVGMYVGTRDGKLTVLEVLKGAPATPAQKAGFKKGDFIVKIGDESTINMTVSEAVEKIRGTCGTAVSLTIKRPTAEDPEKLDSLTVPVERGKVIIKSVESKLIKDWNQDSEGLWKGGVGYVQVRNFDKNTTPSLSLSLNRLKDENKGQPLAGLILDLRNNSGGLLTQAINMSDLFLETGDIVITAGRNNRISPTPAGRDGIEPDYPIVVLANEQSASGAEIVIGALQKNNRAIVLGSRTFGKGSVQQLHQLQNDVQLKITVSEYLIPGKISIQENGVVPDILAQPTIDDDDIDLFPNELSAGERNYEKHIVSTYAKKETPRYTLNYLLLPQERDGSEDRFMSGELEPEKDKLVQMALSLMKLGGKPWNPSEIFVAKKEDILKQREELFQEVVKHLKEKGIDWSEDPSGSVNALDSSTIELELSSKVIQEPSKEKDDPVPVNKLLLTARLTNKGTKPLHRMKGLSKSEHFLYKDLEFLFGKVEAGQSVDRTAKVRLPYFPYSRNDLVHVEVSSTGELPGGDTGPTDKVALSKTIEIELKDSGRPAFAYCASLLDTTSGLPLLMLKEGKRATLRARIQNVGTATAHKGIAILRNETGRQIFLEKGRIEFTNLAPQAATEVEFLFEVRSGEPLEEYKFELVAADSYSNAAISRKLTVPRGDSNTAKPFPNGINFAPPTISATIVDPESNQSVLSTLKDHLKLAAIIKSADPDDFKAWVISSIASEREVLPDKIFFTSAAGKDELKIDTSVPLRKGINLFTVISNTRNGLESRQSLVVRRQ